LAKRKVKDGKNADMGVRRGSHGDFLTQALAAEAGFHTWGVEKVLEEFRKGRTETWHAYGNAHSLVIGPSEATIALEPFGDGEVLDAVTLTHDELVQAMRTWAHRGLN
jgi:hypothetical protein